jgi:FkbM family methyltransferase
MVLASLKRLVIGSPIEHHARTLWETYRRLRPARRGPDQDANDRYDDETVEIARRVLTGQGICVDAGAHTGQMLARFVAASPGSRFVAVEPIPGLADHVQRRFPHVTVVQTAVADFDGEAEFRHVMDAAQVSSIYVRAERESGRRVETLKVPVRRLDNILDLEGPQVEFVKVDVEGAELAALRGASRLLAEHHPVIVLECDPTVIGDVGNELSKYGYAIRTLAGWLARDAALDDAGLLAAKAAGEFYFAASLDSTLAG